MHPTIHALIAGCAALAIAITGLAGTPRSAAPVVEAAPAPTAVVKPCCDPRGGRLAAILHQTP